MCKTEKCYKAFFQPGSHQIPSSEEYNLCRQVSVAPTDQGKYQGDVCSFRIVYSVCVCVYASAVFPIHHYSLPGVWLRAEWWRHEDADELQQ